MARRFSSNTVRTVGALLPSDVLAKAMEGEGLEGLEPEAYGLEQDQRFRDVVTDAWNEARSLWWSFQRELDELPEDDVSATSLTREKWLLPLLELLGFDDVEVMSKAFEVSGSEYPISHSRGNTPLHLMGARLELDGRVSGIPGAARLSPHSLLQQFLNRSDDHLWGLVTNGKRLRILRDSVSLTRQAYVEFDLEAMFSGDVFPDFILLYRIVHASRFEGHRPEDYLLEEWIASAREEGIRALDQLRDGVEAALTELGTGFLSHPSNTQLRKLVEEDELESRDMYRYLLRLVYRLLFLFVAEDRDLLLVPETSPEARDRYDRYYSTARIRDLAARPATPGHTDLWAGLGVLMRILGRDEGEPALGLPGLGSFLWAFDAIGPLIDSDIDNDRLVEAVRSLAYVQEEGSLRRIDFAALGAEELGSVYESLLELHPAIDEERRAFSLGAGAGSERKTTGSYYTPTELISELLNSALVPVLEEAAGKDDPENAILELKVIDPAAGSGHFLVAAAHRIAKRLAEVRTGEPESPEDEYRTAVRDVVSRCLFAVDINDLAVELCKVSLWLEALEPGKPLSFLDHHILHGNSLFGATPAAIADGIPNEAFVTLTGDDKKVVSVLKKRNRKERAGQEELTFDSGEVVSIGEELKALEGFDDSDLETVRTKEKMLSAWKSSTEYEHAKLVADSWCAAFAMEKTSHAPELTHGVFRRLRDDRAVDPGLRDAIQSLADHHRFFHWHLGFPQVFQVDDESSHDGPGWGGGFDVVLGNPPWERITIGEREWFAGRDSRISEVRRAATRRRMIRELEESDPQLFSSYQMARRESESLKAMSRAAPNFRHGSKGDVNTFALFTELAAHLRKATGSVGLIVPSGLATDFTTADLFLFLVSSGWLESLLELENEGFFDIGQGHMNRFCLLTLRETTGDMRFVFRGSRLSDLHRPEKQIYLSSLDLKRLNPNTLTCPAFDSRKDAEIAKDVYAQMGVLDDQDVESGHKWGVRFMSMYHLSTDAQTLKTRQELEENGFQLEGSKAVRGKDVWAPVIEGKMVHQFDHRFGDYGRLESGERGHVLPRVPSSDKADPHFQTLPRYWVPEEDRRSRISGSWSAPWLAGWRDVADSRASARTAILTVLPDVATESGLPLLTVAPEHTHVFFALCLNINSLPFDFFCRQKVGGNHLKQFIMRQLPVVNPGRYSDAAPWEPGFRLIDWFKPRFLELVVTSSDLLHVAEAMNAATTSYTWDTRRREVLFAEVDAAFAHLYALDHSALTHALDSFPALRRSEIAEHGEYRRRRLVLDAYEQMSLAIDAGQPYQTILDPPPADPSLRVDIEAPL